MRRHLGLALRVAACSCVLTAPGFSLDEIQTPATSGGTGNADIWSADVLRNGDIILNISAWAIQDADGHTDHAFVPLNITVGILNRAEVWVDTPFGWSQDSSPEDQSGAGFADMTLGAKLQVLRQESQFVSASALSVVMLPTGDPGDSLGEKHGSVAVGGAVSRTFGAIDVDANALHHFTPDNQNDVTRAAFGFTYHVSQEVGLLTQLKMEDWVVQDDHPLVLEGGARLTHKSGASLIGTAGVGLDDGLPDWEARVGLSWTGKGPVKTAINMRKANRSMKDRLSALEDENSRLKARIKELEEVVKSCDDAKESLQSEVDQLKKKLGDQVEIKEDRDKVVITLLDEVFFDSGKAGLKPEGVEIMKKVADLIRQSGSQDVRIEGHCDGDPVAHATYPTRKYPSNWELSTVRACAVLRHLNEKAGVDENILSAHGYSFTKPKADNTTPEGKRRNRRVEIIIMKPQRSE